MVSKIEIVSASRGPNFIIAGTMKGGTTALYDFINEHPKVVPASHKEVHYFTMHFDKGLEWYQSQFSEIKENGFITGEASPTYFDLASTRLIPSMIVREFPDVKIILIVRDPVERAISHFDHYCIVNKIESMQKMGAEKFFNLPYSSAIKCTSMEERLLYQALNFSCYLNKYRNFKSVFKENILVLDNVEVREHPYRSMDRVFDFLGLQSYQSESFKKIKYSAGNKASKLSRETRKKLGDFLYPDYELFCKEAGLLVGDVN